MRRTLTLGAVTAALVVAMPMAAFAHDCLNASRSDTGSQNSANGNWFYISEAEVVGFISSLVGVDPADVGDEFLAAVEAEGLPTSFSIFIGKLVIGTNPNTHELVASYQDGVKSSNGKGIDHAEELVGRYVQIMLDVLS